MGDTPSTPLPVPASCLIIADGSIATLVAVWREAVCRPAGGGATAETSKPLLWAPAGLATPAAGANDKFAQSAGLAGVVQSSVLAASDGLAASAMLLAAGEEASRRGVGRVVWPVQFAATTEDHRLTLVGGAFDRALLAARLLSIDTRQSTGQSVIIHTPFAELSDAQLMDLAADMDVPVGAAWWCERQTTASQTPCGKCGPCLRWLAAMKQAGIVAPVAVLPATLLEEKPAVAEVV
jgi:hypothetical protein